MLLVAENPSLTRTFTQVRDLTDLLASRLSAEDQTPQSMPDASPTKWHRAHTSWFFEEFALRPDASYQAFDSAYRFLFNSYYEAVGARAPRPERGLITRPGAADIGRYRQHVENAVAERLDRGDFGDATLDIIQLGCHHEQQHQELLLMDAKHLLSRHGFDPVYVERPPEPETAAPVQAWRKVDGGLVEIGHDGDGFAYDNEGPRHTAFIQPFEIAERVVTNAEWCEFIADGGYSRPELWLSAGWATLQATGWNAPEYWRLDDDAWTTFTLSGRRPVRGGEPVCHISYYEADAFARWAGGRLPTEHEWEAACISVTDKRGALLDPSRCHPDIAANAMIGDVWQWTSSDYAPYPGFVPVEGAVGEYNGKFMCDQHVLRGASALTPRGHERMTYRNFFPASARWAMSGLRLARS